MFIIYGTSSCVWCDRAKALLTNAGFEYKYVDVKEDLEAQEMFVSKRFKTVPQVFSQEIHIGGYEDLMKFLDGVIGATGF